MENSQSVENKVVSIEYLKSIGYTEDLNIERMEERYIKKALKKFNDNREATAKALGIAERTLYSKLKKYNINVK